MKEFFSVPRLWPGEAVFIIGGGPSIKGFDCERLKGSGRVIAVNDAGLYMAPWADVLFWADKRWFGWNHDKLSLHTGQWKIARAEPHLATEHDIKVMRFAPGKLARRPDTVGGICGGAAAINIACHFGARVIVLLGFDMRPGNWHNNHKQPPLEGQHRNKFIPAIEAMAPDLEQEGVLVLNTNADSALRCFPFADIEELLAMDDIALAEREKYIAVWQTADYRKVSPGLLECERAHLGLGMQPGETLTDFGSGSCRATRWFMDHGIAATGVDFAPNASEHPEVSFVEANLWELPATLMPTDYGFCCDVMEHIPEAKVADVLAGIASRVKVAAWFRIATRPDKMGPNLLGQPLHLTVKPGEWWRRQIEMHFRTVDVIEDNRRDIVLLARP